MNRLAKTLLLFLFLISPLLSEEPFTPWFTGPIVAPRSTAVPLGHVELDNYIYFQTFTGVYDKSWNEIGTDNFYVINPQLLYYFGLTPWMDIEIAPSVLYQFTKGQQTLLFGDFTAALDFQLYQNDDFWFPSIKFSLSEIFPTGKYQHFNPQKLQTDFGGFGTYGTGFTLLFHKIYHLYGKHSLSLSLANIYTVNSRVHVKGINAYGGGYGTNGKVEVGNNYQALFSFEYSFNQNWNFAMDTIWTHNDASPFSGDPGLDSLGEEASVGKPSSESLSFCPAIEYGFSENLGMVGGCWFTALGRNTDVLRTAAVNIYCYF